MGGVERLDVAMRWKVAAKCSEKTRVKSTDKARTHADGIRPLACERAGRVQQLLIISLYRTRHWVAVLIVMHLTDVLQRCMGLVAIAGAELGEHSVTDGRRRQTKDLPLDVGTDG